MSFPTVLDRLLLLFAYLSLLAFPFYIWFFQKTLSYLRIKPNVHNHLPEQLLYGMFRTLCTLLFLYSLKPYYDFQFDTVSFIFLHLLCVHGAIYLAAGYEKLKQGEQWYSWLKLNKLYYILPGAYVWGWLGFLKEKHVIQLTKLLKLFNKPLMFFVLLVQLLPLISLLSPEFLNSYMLGAAFLHLGIFLLAGICFWEFAFVDLSFYYVFSATDLMSSFNFLGFDKAILFSFLLFAIIHFKFFPILRLAWWEGPYYAHMFWLVKGKSGKLYRLYHDFMDPYEMSYAQYEGTFLLNRKIIRNHLGHLRALELRDQLIASRGSREKIAKIIEEYGTLDYDPERLQEHAYHIAQVLLLQQKGVSKQFVPSLFKAPFTHFYRWGKFPAFRRQEDVEQVLIGYREVFFDEEKFIFIAEKMHLVLDLKRYQKQ
ncbi:MAG: hypothetical protein GWP59_08175 [Chlamydiales bacterium]|nr:hypothetical protein [Chlamydiales bacterium]